jgi:TonB family protein
MEDRMKAAIFSTLCLLAICSPARAQVAPQIYKPGDGVTAPKVLKEVKAEYPPEAMKAGVAGIVRMECVVQADGTPNDIRVVVPLEPTVDAAAIQALKGWKFTPGQKDGQAVPVLVQVEMSFTTAAVRGPRLDSPGVFRSGPGITSPKLVHETKPSYTATARNAGVQGNVLLDCVILTDGSVGDVRVSKHLDNDLDAEAIRTVRQWKFTPGEKEGQAVPVQVSIELTFALR